jgi:hypothetical protein
MLTVVEGAAVAPVGGLAAAESPVATTALGDVSSVVKKGII